MTKYSKIWANGTKKVFIRRQSYSLDRFDERAVKKLNIWNLTVFELTKVIGHSKSLWSSDSSSKFGCHFSNKGVLKLKSEKKMIFSKKVRLNWYCSMKFFFRKIRMIFDIEIHFESPKLALFDELSPDGDSKSGNFIWLQLILGQKPCFLGPIQLVTQKVNIHYST